MQVEEKGDKEGKEVEEGEVTLEISSSSSKKLEEINGGDTSLLSGDITIDSIRDHM